MSKAWPMVRLGEVLKRSPETLTLKPDAEYREVTVRLWGKGVVLRGVTTGACIAGERRFVARAGQLILSRIDARNGAIGIVPPDLDGAVVTNDFPLFNLDRRRVEPEFLGWLTRTRQFVDLCKRASEGTTNRVRLKEERLLSLEVCIPPLQEQQRLVARIEEIAVALDEAQSLRRLCVEEVGAAFEAAVTDRFSHLGRAAPRRLGDLAQKIGSGSTPRGGRESYLSDGIPLIRSQNVRMRKFQWAGMAYIDSATHEGMAGTQVQGNDVLLNITGASIGRVACAPADLREANVNQHVAIIRPTPGVEPRFLMYWLSQRTIQEFINAEQRGATRQALTKAQIEALQIPLPAIIEQRRLVAELDALQAEVDTLNHLQAETVVEINALRPAVLDRAFRGEL